MSRTIRLGTRGSALALAQSGQVANALRRLGVEVVLVPLNTPGDLDTRPLTGRAHEGIFTSSVHGALRDREIDLAVHSFKDLPTDDVAGIVVAAVPVREDPRDAFITRGTTITALEPGSRVGTCSARRAAWVRRTRPDLDVVPIRGNIDDRIARVTDGEFDAIILAAAGINRLGIEPPAMSFISADDLVPAPAQGALALECRAEDGGTRELLLNLNHHDSHVAALAERAVLAAIDPTDSTAVGALATVIDSRLHLLADICEPDGTGRIIRRDSSLPTAARDLGERVGHALMGSRMSLVS